MAVKEAVRQLLPEQHAERIVLEDHFGHRHEIKIHPIRVRDADPARGEPAGELMYEPVDQSAEVEKARRMMERREELFLKSCLEHPVHRLHPAVVSHPLHPAHSAQAENTGAGGTAMADWPAGDCSECG